MTDSRTKAMSQTRLIFDLHLDLSMNALLYNRDLRWSLERIRRWEHIQANASGKRDKVDRGNNTVCFPEMRRGRVGLCVATQIGRYSTYFHKLPGWNSPEQAWANTQGQLAWYRAMEEAGELKSIRNRADLDAHLEVWLNTKVVDDSTAWTDSQRTPRDKPPIGYILSLEGADSIVTLDHLHRSYEDGLRALGLSHYGPGRYAHGTDEDGPLPEAGKQLLKEMQQLGIILDVTHLCDRCFWEALDCYDGPLWASHQNCRKLAPWNRQFADDQIRAVVERGGVLGMAFDAIMMVPGWVHLRSRPEEFNLRIERICEHIDHVCQLAGSAQHVAIGTDLDGGFGTEQTPMDLDSIADLRTLPGLLRERGYTDEDVTGILWANAVEFLRRAWG
jgi:membrane dipeptidase